MLALILSIFTLQTAVPGSPMPPVREWAAADVVLTRRPVPEFPARAISSGVREGVVTLDCEAARNGGFANCRVVSETPSVAGFGNSAVSAMRRARFAPGPDAPAPGDVVRGIVIRFWRPA
ncbi:TonB family protein [Brevundimonas lenta]|uniref:TonB family protein n=1 Tax=Brevundimonas lenta TaxID=424796 RepID=A0A7W6NQ87_9CAUL|nr:TonB family protein [Brevundimonas lenta]MBB4084270.1 TonB family protein [Brevundimonas lenta]